MKSKSVLVEFLVNSDFAQGADFAAHIAQQSKEELVRRYGADIIKKNHTVRDILNLFYSTQDYAWLEQRKRTLIAEEARKSGEFLNSLKSVV